jgi:hypothetical protein
MAAASAGGGDEQGGAEEREGGGDAEEWWSETGGTLELCFLYTVGLPRQKFCQDFRCAPKIPFPLFLSIENIILEP